MGHVPLAYGDPSTPLRVREEITRDGFCVLRDVFDEAILTMLRCALDMLTRRPPTDPGISWLSPAAGGGLVVQRISRANLYDPIIDRYISKAPELLAVGSWVFDCPDSEIAVATGLTDGSDGVVAVIKDSRNVSEHAALRWHRDDTFTAHLNINPFVNCGVYLDDSDCTSGALLVIPKGRTFPRESGETVDGILDQVLVVAEAGDVVVHAADVWHRSGPSTRPQGLRRVVYGNVFQMRR